MTSVLVRTWSVFAETVTNCHMYANLLYVLMYVVSMYAQYHDGIHVAKHRLWFEMPFVVK